MSRNTERMKARVDQLSDELAIGAALRLRADASQIKPIVDAVVAYLVEEYPSQDLYIPAQPSGYPEDEIRRDARSMSKRALCKKYRCSRRTIDRILATMNHDLEMRTARGAAP